MILLPDGMTDADSRRAKRALESLIERLDGAELSQRKDADVRWLEKRIADEQTRQLLAQMPKGLYCQLTGRRHAQVDDLAAKHRLPIDGAQIDLYAVMRRIHDILAETRARGAVDEEPDGDFADLEKQKLKEEVKNLIRKNELLLHQIEEERGTVIPREEIRERLTWLSVRLRALGAQFRKCKTGAEAADKLNTCLEQVAAEVEEGQLHW